jgi:hypothetical protein
MSTVTIKGWMVGYHWDFQKPDEVSWIFHTIFDPKVPNKDQVECFAYTFEVEVPDKVDIVAGLVRGLEAAKLKALQDYQRTVAEINHRLAQLQAIENAPTTDERDAYRLQAKEAQ